MCGIAGYFLKPGKVAIAGCLDIMGRKLAHRGPDGTHSHVTGRAGFVQTRLAIVDIAGGAQPFVRQKDTAEIMLAANGEIYNHQQLRGTELADTAFASQSDCEVLLPLWLRHGTDMAHSLRGMYAAALYRSDRDEGCLLRDPFGIKPLYYFEDDSGLYFASEIPALRAIQKQPGAPDALAGAFVLDKQYIGGGRTAFADITAVPGGGCLTIKGGRIHKATYMPALPAHPPGWQSDPEQLENILYESVQAHQMSDVPFGMFLSGGVDSASLLYLMSRLHKDAPHQHVAHLHAYTARFDSRSVADESALARELAGLTGAEFIDVSYDEKRFFAEAGEVVTAMDMPVADYAILPSFALAKRAAEDVKVILVGEGGDEFFAGYGRYRAGLRLIAQKHSARPGPALNSGILRPQPARLLASALDARAGMMPSFFCRLTDQDRALKTLQAYDCSQWLADNLLIKLDRCLMHNSLEGRTPFVDRLVSDFGYHLPLHEKIRRRQGKFALKAWLERRLPAARPFARKRGFSVPVGRWIAGHAGQLAPLIAAQPGLAELVRPDMVAGIIADADRRGGLLAWRLLFYALWHQIHVMGADGRQPVADILSARP